MTGTEHTQTFEFKSEARQLLDLMIHSLYSHKEVFLRELISNSSDALDRLRFEALTEGSLRPEGHEFEIRVESDSEARTLTIRDTGIGMSRQEVIDNLGTIARSGTKEFVAKLATTQSETEREQLIGQFGVGFYSSFMVADEVKVVTRRAGEDTATAWSSTGDGTYTIADAEREVAGTTITLHLKAADEENNLADFTDRWVLRRTIKKYSDFVQHPIRLREERQEVERDEEGEPVEGAESKTVVEWKDVNSRKAIWTRPASEVTEEEYNEFYKHVSHDWTDPLDRIAFKGEGTFLYYALLFIPERAPHDLFYRNSRFGLQLFVNRIMVMDEARDLLPDYLRFLKGVVDSPDLSLNVSREILQKDRRVNSIRGRITKKVLDALAYMQEEDTEKYLKFWNAFGRLLKEGAVQDHEHRDKLNGLLWLESSHTEHDAEDHTRFTTLKAYVERMKEEQEAIYYIVAENRSAAEKSPHLEAFLDKGYEVLYLLDPFDEIMVANIGEFDGKRLQSVGKGDVELGSEEDRKKAREELEDKESKHRSLLEFIKDELETLVKDVRLSTRLKNSPVCLVGEESDMSPQLRKLLEEAGQEVPESKRILEINPDHAVLARMQDAFDHDGKTDKLTDYAHLLHGQALLAEGSPLPDPVAFSKRVADLMVRDASH